MGYLPSISVKTLRCLTSTGCTMIQIHLLKSLNLLLKSLNLLFESLNLLFESLNLLL